MDTCKMTCVSYGSRSLYVKNLNFKTSDESVKQHFSEHMKGGKILSVKKHIKNGKSVSSGFGFVEFDCVNTAVNVCKDLHESVLDGHTLVLQLCHAKKDDILPNKIENDRSLTKLIVRNVAFEATEKDLRQLFNPFGQNKEFKVANEIWQPQRVCIYRVMSRSKKLGTLLKLFQIPISMGVTWYVLERAKEGESLEELRARTAAAQFADSAKLYNKKRKHLAVSDERNVKFGVKFWFSFAEIYVLFLETNT
ncbi:hypothetical protein OROMI_021914 [Orobanche minor]